MQISWPWSFGILGGFYHYCPGLDFFISNSSFFFFDHVIRGHSWLYPKIMPNSVSIFLISSCFSPRKWNKYFFTFNKGPFYHFTYYNKNKSFVIRSIWLFFKFFISFCDRKWYVMSLCVTENFLCVKKRFPLDWNFDLNIWERM